MATYALATAGYTKPLKGRYGGSTFTLSKIVADAIALLVTKETSYSGNFIWMRMFLRDSGIGLAQL